MRCSNFITFHGHSGSRSPIINKAMGLKATQQTSSFSGLVGLEVVYWPLVAKFAGSHPTEAFGFLGRKNPQPSVPCRSFTACKRSLNVTCKSAFRQKLPDISRPQFHLPPLSALAWRHAWRRLVAKVGTSNHDRTISLKGCSA